MTVVTDTIGILALIFTCIAFSFQNETKLRWTLVFSLTLWMLQFALLGTLTVVVGLALGIAVLLARLFSIKYLLYALLALHAGLLPVALYGYVTDQLTVSAPLVLMASLCITIGTTLFKKHELSSCVAIGLSLNLYIAMIAYNGTNILLSTLILLALIWRSIGLYVTQRRKDNL